MNATTMTEDTSVQRLNDLADALAAASTWIFDYRRRTPDADHARLVNLETALDLTAIKLRAASIRILGERTEDAIRALQGAAEKVEAFMEKVKRIEAALAVVNAILGVAGAALIGDAQGVLTTAKSLDALLDENRKRKSAGRHKEAEKQDEARLAVA